MIGGRAKTMVAKMPETVQEQAEREIERITNIPQASPEYSVTLDYIEWLSALPWQVGTEDHHDIEAAREILDADHYGLDKVKERILEFLSVVKLAGKLKGPILCFVGPPGVGKTSLGRSIADATGRKFVRVSLGGTRDEAEIRGHRRTYIGSMPGRIIQGLKKAGSRNPVFCSMRSTNSAAISGVIPPQRCSRYSTLNRTSISAITTSKWIST